MSFQFFIEGHTPTSVYHPGDTISGTLQLNGAIRDDNFKVTLELLGRSEVYACGELAVPYFNDSRQTVTLFSESKTLFEGSCDLQAGQDLFWSFEFTFPERTKCDGDWGDGMVYGRKKLFQTENHALPPSIHITGSNPRVEGRISYELRACGKYSSRWKRDIRKNEELVLRRRWPAGRPKEADLESMWPYEGEKKFRLHPKFDRLIDPNFKLTCWKWGQYHINERPEPFVCCRMLMKRHYRFDISNPESVSFDMQIRWLPIGKLDFEVPDIKLLEVEMSCYALSVLRVKGSLASTYSRLSLKSKDLDMNMGKGKWVDLSVNLEDTEEDLKGFFQLGNFQSFCISRFYTGVTNLKLEAAGKILWVTFGSDLWNCWVEDDGMVVVKTGVGFVDVKPLGEVSYVCEKVLGGLMGDV